MAKIVEEVLVLKVSYLVKENQDGATVFNEEVEATLTEVAQQVVDGVKPGAIVEVEKA